MTPLAPVASTSTVSLVDRQPSESTRSKLTPVAAFSAVCSTAGVDDRVGGEDDEHRGQARREHAGALGHAADASSRRRCCTVVFGTVSVVMIARAASGPPSLAQRLRPRR